MQSLNNSNELNYILGINTNLFRLLNNTVLPTVPSSVMFNTTLNNVTDRKSPFVTAVDIQVGLVLRRFALKPHTNLHAFLVCVLSFSA